MVRHVLIAAALAVFLSAPILASGQAVRFDVDRAMATIRYLSVDIGVRHGGSSQERRAAEFLRRRLEAIGYSHIQEQVFDLPNGNRSRNIIAEKPGDSADVIVIGSHMDSKGPSPGANDNGSGDATVLELARLLKPVATHHTLRFIFFGSEEVLNRDQPDGHHFGSRYYVPHLSESERGRIKGMICIDSVAAGPLFVIGNMQGGSPLASDLREKAHSLGYSVLDQTDPGWSDHEAFEGAGVPTAYVRWRIDDTLHTKDDAYSHCRKDKVLQAGRVVLQTCIGL